jgi:hypothetical protein
MFFKGFPLYSEHVILGTQRVDFLDFFLHWANKRLFSLDLDSLDLSELSGRNRRRTAPAV